MNVCCLLAVLTTVGFNDGWRLQRAGEPTETAVTVPHDAMHDRGLDRAADPGQGYVPCVTATYRKSFARPVGAGRFALRFDGVYQDSTVRVNGRAVGGRANGFLPFEVPLDDLAASNEVEVVCSSVPGDSIWYQGCGILRNVWLVRRTGAFTLEPENVLVTTDLLPDGSARVSVAVDGAKVVSPAGGELIVREPKLWTPETPNLHVLDVTAEDAKGARDTCCIRYGIRTVEFTKDRGLLLNGRPYRIRGICRHETFGALGAALNLAATKRELSMCKRLGANAIRPAHNPFSPEFYSLCDEMGFLVMAEFANEWRVKKHPNGYSRFFDACWRQDLTDFIRRDRNHPSIVLWSVGNEIWDLYHRTDGAAVTRELVAVVHALDRSRPATAALNNPSGASRNRVPEELDVVGLNYMPAWYAKFKGLHPLFGSETAPCPANRDTYLFEETADRLIPIQATNHLESAYCLKTFNWAQPAEFALKVQRDAPWSAGEFAWCTYDYLGEGEHSGVKKRNYWPARGTYWGFCDRAGLPKDRFYLYQSQWRSDRPVAHLLPDWTFPGKEGKIVPVWCYTNGEEAELFLNGVSQGVRHFADTKDLHLAWDVAYRPGTLEVRAKMKDGRVAVDRRRTAGPVASLRVTKDYASDGFAFFRIDAVDAAGTRVLACEEEISVTVKNGTLVALDNGSPLDHSRFASPTRRLFRGSLVAIVRTGTGEPSIHPVRLPDIKPR